MKNKHFTIMATFLFVMTGLIPAQVKEAAESIKAADIQKHINYLASDALMGRRVPTPAGDTAAAYIMREFKAYGLKPVNGSYYQKVLWGKDNTKPPFNNVVGFLEGSDPELKKEILIIGGHYDHVGPWKNSKFGQDSIYNGADDNASGTAGVMVLAKTFCSMSERPKRSILFVAFGGEELGLVGSSFYCKNPLFPLEHTIAMLNMDMISRNDPGMVYIVASKKSPDLAQINEKENEKIGLKLDYSQDVFIGSSDHAPFLAKKVPSLFFFTGITKVLHSPKDEADTIDSSKAERIARLVFYNAYYISNDNQHYKVN
jgi:Zn-dependent M28 family amino/carboxypeptidase